MLEYRRYAAQSVIWEALMGWGDEHATQHARTLAGRVVVAVEQADDRLRGEFDMGATTSSDPEGW